jgi:hypothetical protein
MKPRATVSALQRCVAQQVSQGSLPWRRSPPSPKRGAEREQRQIEKRGREKIGITKQEQKTLLAMFSVYLHNADVHFRPGSGRYLMDLDETT